MTPTPKPEPTPPQGHDATLDGFRRALATPKSEIEKREKEWREKQPNTKRTKE